MSGPRRRNGARPIAAVVLAAAGAWIGSPRPAPADDVVIIQPEVQNRINEATFNQWALGGRSLDTARQRFETLLALKVEDIDRTCKLSEVQKQKLELAGHGDVKRFLDRVDELKRKVVNVPMPPAQFNQVLGELRPFQATFESDPFDEKSIFAKTLRTCLTAEQAAAHAKAVREKAEFRFRTTVDLVVAMVDRQAGLSSDQRTQFRNLLREETRPPAKSGPYDYYVLIWQAARIPEAKVRPIFDDAQWRALGVQFDRARQLEPTLEQGGFLPAGAVAARGAPALPPP